MVRDDLLPANLIGTSHFATKRDARLEKNNYNDAFRLASDISSSPLGFPGKALGQIGLSRSC